MVRIAYRVLDGGKHLFGWGNQHQSPNRAASRRRVVTRAVFGASALILSLFASGQSFAEDRALKLYNLHTRERATIVFKRNGVYDREGLKALNTFLRDWRKNEPTKMDPHLFDLIWQVYKESGSRDYINIICGYRSPATNGALRRRSTGVAKNSLHMQGKAMDFFIPDVPLAKLRAIGLRMQDGGVGFYPTSGSPFVHMDTGSVRHWPRMTRQQLVKVFPNGGTLHVPTDGKPLPGYSQALAAYKARKAGLTSTSKVASFSGSPLLKNDSKAIGKPIVIAAADSDDEDEEAIDTDVARKAAPDKRVAGVAVASYATAPVPVPRIAPRRAAPPPVVVAAAMPEPAGMRAAGAPDSIGNLTRSLTPDFDFGGPQDWSQPAVPAALAAAMAERDQTRRGASLPIPPTAVVATIDVNRPLRADAITSAVLRRTPDNANSGRDVPTLLAYAPAPLPAEPVTYASAAGSIPMPRVSPLHRAATGTPLRQPIPAAEVERTLTAPHLTMTALDTQGLRMWIGSTSTRQKAYAVLTMPDFSNGHELMQKPELALAAGFGLRPYDDLRTDRFTGALVAQPAVVDLRFDSFVASTR